MHCRVAAVPGGHHVTVTGEIDMQTAPQLAETLLQFANGAVTVDLRNVTFMDSSGVHALLQAHTHITQRKRLPRDHRRQPDRAPSRRNRRTRQNAALRITTLWQPSK
jgi:hypothetical protein